MFKINHNLPVRNFQVEKQVIERTRNNAIRVELDPAVAERLIETLIQASVQAQEILFEQPLHSIEASGKRILIVGFGKMGKWFGRFFESQGHSITVIDPIRPEDDVKWFPMINETSFEDQDFLFLATPLNKTQAILRDIIELKPRIPIIEIASVKSHLLELIEDAKLTEIDTVSIHPMFGPNVRTLQHKTLIICQSGIDEVTNQVKGLFEDTALNIIEIPLEKHDAYMAVTLNQAHLLNLLNGFVLDFSDFSLEELQQVTSQTFEKQMKTTMEVFSEDPNLYYSIQKLNKFTPQTFQAFSSQLSILKKLIDQDLQEDFYQRMLDIRSDLSKFQL